MTTTLRKFKGKSFDRLMAEIQKEFKDNYRVKDTKKTVKKPFWWMKEFEVQIEVIEESEWDQKARPPKKTDPKKQMIIDMLEGSGSKIPMSDGTAEQTEKQMANMQNMMKQLIEKLDKDEQPQTPIQTGYLQAPNESALLHYYNQMLESDVDEKVAKRMIEEVKEDIGQKNWENKNAVETRLLKKMSASLRVTGGFNLHTTKIIALVGPTGVGKTTTIAKIAAYLKQKNKKIGLITTDVYRIGATDQLDEYAKILESEMLAVTSPEELKEAILTLTHSHKVDQILIDTVGRSPLDIGSIEDIKEYLQVASPDHTALVLSSTQKKKDIYKILENFGAANLDSLLFTKLDETINHGIILNALADNDMKVSYVTNGQNVPYDIYQATSEALAKKILNGVDDFGPSIITS